MVRTRDMGQSDIGQSAGCSTKRAARLAAVWLVVALAAIWPGHSRAEKPLDVDRLLDPNHVVDVRMEIPDQDWDRMRKQARDFVTAFTNPSAKPFKYVRGDVTIDGVRIESVGFRKKGLFGSLDEESPSLKIKFDEFQDQSPVRGMKRMTLNNNKQDAALISQRLASMVFNAAGVHAPRVGYARVHVNGKDLGIYSHVESVEKPFLKRRFGDESGDLYEGTLTDFFPKSVEKLELKTNESASHREKAARLAALLAAPGELDVDEVGRIVDLDNFLRYWAVESLIGWWDGYANNQNNYFAYENPENGKFYFMPWGVDAAFMSTTGPFGMFGGADLSPAVYAQGMLTNRLYRAPGMADRYRETMLKVLDEAWKEDELLAEIDRIEKLFASGLPNRHAGMADAMKSNRAFITARRAAVLKALEDWPGKIPEQARTPMYIVDVGSAKGSFQATWREESKETDEKGTAKVTVQLDGKPLVMEKVTVVAQPFRFPGFGGGGRGPMPPPPATIVLAGTRVEDQKAVTITIMLARDRLAEPPGEALAVGGSLLIGPPSFVFFGNPAMKSITGQMTLTKSGVETGSELVGDFDLKLVEIHGGMFNAQRPKPKPADDD